MCEVWGESLCHVLLVQCRKTQQSLQIANYLAGWSAPPYPERTSKTAQTSSTTPHSHVWGDAWERAEELNKQYPDTISSTPTVVLPWTRDDGIAQEYANTTCNTNQKEGRGGEGERALQPITKTVQWCRVCCFPCAVSLNKIRTCAPIGSSSRREPSIYLRWLVQSVPPCVAQTCAVRPVFARARGELRAAKPSKCPMGHEANASSGALSGASNRSWNAGHQQHPGPENQDSTCGIDPGGLVLTSGETIPISLTQA